MAKNKQVGYKTPPTDSQWKPGQSGNPSGKKKGKKSPQPMPETLMAILNESMQITLAGKKQISSTAEAFLRAVLHNLFNAPVKLQLEGLKLLKALGVFELQADASEQQCDYDDPFSEEDRRILKILQEEMSEGEIGEQY